MQAAMFSMTTVAEAIVYIPELEHARADGQH
jgi:hypothetical protein